MADANDIERPVDRRPFEPIVSLSTERDLIDSMVRYEKFAKRTGKTVVDLPFECGLCHKKKMELEMIDGDGYPICVGCIDDIAAAMG